MASTPPPAEVPNASPPPLKIPPSVSNASRTDLERLLVTTLHKLKAKDKRLSELEQQATEQCGSEGKEIIELRNVIEGLQAKLLESETRFGDRLRAETDLLEERACKAEEDGRLKDNLIIKLREDKKNQSDLVQELETKVKDLNRKMEEVDQGQHECASILKQREQELEIQREELEEQRRHEEKMVQEVEELRAMLAKRGEDTVKEDDMAELQKRAEELERALKETRLELDEKIEELSRLKQSTKEAKREELTMKLEEEVASLKASLKEAHDEIAGQPKPGIAEAVRGTPEIDLSMFVPKEDFVSLQNELKDAKKKFALTLKRRQAEAEKQISSLQDEITQKQNSLGGAARDETSADVAQIRKEVETERIRFKKALAELKRRNESLTQSNLSLEEKFSALEIEYERIKSEILLEKRKAVEASTNAEQVSESFKEYKSRAHALLKMKEEEIKEARVASRDQFEKEIVSLQEKASKAEKLMEETSAKLDQSKCEFAEQLRQLKTDYEGRLAEAEKTMKNATESAKASNRQYEQMKIRQESYDNRIQSLKNQLEEAEAELQKTRTSHVEIDSIKPELADLRNKAAMLEKENDSLMEMNKMMETEISDLKSTVKQLRKAITLRNSIQGPDFVDRQNSNGTIGSSYDYPSSPRYESNNDASLGSKTIEQLNKDVTLARRRVSETEQEVDDLERELALRSALESALKENVRELQRELDRVKLASKEVDMEYFKNILLKLFETGEEESLLPVVSTMLTFSPAETERCRQAMEDRKARHAALLESATNASANMTSAMMDWLGLSSSNDEKR